jgi:putative transposon-encoded protein
MKKKVLLKKKETRTTQEVELNMEKIYSAKIGGGVSHYFE